MYISYTLWSVCMGGPFYIMGGLYIPSHLHIVSTMVPQPFKWFLNESGLFAQVFLFTDGLYTGSLSLYKSAF